MISEHPMFIPVSIVLGVSSFFLIVLLVTRNFPPVKPSDIGELSKIVNQQLGLALCANKPNCVCSQDTRTYHSIKPLKSRGNAVEILSKIEATLLTFKSCKVITKTDLYLHAEFRTFFFGFVDDVEFFIDEKQNQIQIRSASRLGHSDLGTNRIRMEMIRKKFEPSDS